MFKKLINEKKQNKTLIRLYVDLKPGCEFVDIGFFPQGFNEEVLETCKHTLKGITVILEVQLCTLNEL